MSLLMFVCYNLVVISHYLLGFFSKQLLATFLTLGLFGYFNLRVPKTQKLGTVKTLNRLTVFSIPLFIVTFGFFCANIKAREMGLWTLFTNSEIGYVLIVEFFCIIALMILVALSEFLE